MSVDGKVGQVISGGFGKVVIRQRSGAKLEIGELLVADGPGSMILLQVCDLAYGSQLSQQGLELISGVKLEGETDLELLDSELRSYTLAYLKPLLAISNGGSEARVCKTLPQFFSGVRRAEPADFSFLKAPGASLPLGKVRSGSGVLGFDVSIDGEKALSHHILIAAQTGKGKSNLASCMLWGLAAGDYAGVLVLDPHDEYYGRNRIGVKDFPDRNKIVYYTPINPPHGARTLKINIRHVRPSHFTGVVNWTDAQREALGYYSKRYGNRWIEEIMTGELPENFHEGTIAVLRRRLASLLDFEAKSGTIYCNGVFDLEAGSSTINDVLDDLEHSRVVIIDTSSFTGQVELLLGSMFASEILKRHRHYKRDGLLDSKPVVSILVEEAPRVLGKDVVEKGGNVFLSIAREGRKFKVGLVAITQLPSLIPKEILANINTKIILGMEMAPERAALIESAAQDLSQDDRNIASLDKGEAIVTSAFTRFAIPVKIPLLSELVAAAAKEKQNGRMSFPELKE
ncbi:TPA: ATP-binding protein [Candidatus Woesearchaeota archaeon]|nr:ATP-binding protein [Candidatus Woesearchaeota archaeon]